MRKCERRSGNRTLRLPSIDKDQQVTRLESPGTDDDLKSMQGIADWATMKYTVVFEIQPKADFGLPDGSKIVLPAGRNVITFGVTFGPGGEVMTTPSRYRDEKDAIQITMEFGSIGGLLKDNVLSLFVDATNALQAYDLTTKVAHIIARNLSLGRGELFSFKPVSISDGVTTGPPIFQVSIPLGVYAPYDLDMIRRDAAAGELVIKHRDLVMDKALVYYEHGLYLYETLQAAEHGPQGIQDHVDFLSTHFALTLADCMLNWWKAITTIIGDPAVAIEKPGYNSRYRQLGLTEEFFRSRIEPLRKLRNDADIAHYSLERKGLEKIQGLIKITKETTEIVLRAYRDYLSRGFTFAESGPKKT